MLSDSDRNDVRCIGSAINEYCERKCRRLCQAAVGFKQPLLSCYQSDGWFRVISQYVTEAVDGKRFKREGKVRAEFNLEKWLTKTIDGDGVVSMAMLFSAPRAMLNGKSG